MDKYETLYLLARDVMLEEIRRFDLVTQKAMNYLTVISVLLGLAVYPGRWLCGTLLPPVGWLSWSLLAAAILLGIALLVAWVCCFRVMRGQGLYKLPVNTEMITFFDNNELIDIHYALARRIAEGHSANKLATYERTRFLARAHTAIWMAVALFTMVVILGLAYLWANRICRCPTGGTQ